MSAYQIPTFKTHNSMQMNKTENPYYASETVLRGNGREIPYYSIGG